MIKPCPSCGVKNRVPPERLAEEGRCGSCKAPLPAADQPIEVDVAVFDEITHGARVPILVDFWAAWCGPCRMAAPEVQRVAANMAGKALVLKVDTERYADLAQRFGVRGIPNFVVLRDGRVVRQQPGFVSHARMEEWLRSAGA